MNNNRKLLVFGAACAVILIVMIIVFFTKLFPSSGDGAASGEYSAGVNLCRAVPSDAVLVLDIKELGGINALFSDTTSFSYKFIPDRNALALMQQKMSGISGWEKLPVIHSLHYSSKNEVSFFSAVEISSVEISGNDLTGVMPFLKKKKKYNNTVIYSFRDSLAVARYGDVILMSTSSYVLESSIRHLDNGTSIFDNADFRAVYEKNSKKKTLYLNHHQIGKFFSGVVERGFLKYSDFVMRFASWSCFNLSAANGYLGLVGVMESWNEEKYQCAAFEGQQPDKSGMGRILPAGTVFAVSMIFSDMEKYKGSMELFMEVHKKLSGYEYKKKIVEVEGEMKPQQFADSLSAQELVSAYCKFGERYEWLTFIRQASSFGLSDVVSGVISRNKEVEVHPYKFKGYMDALYGEVFSHCNEESYCKLGDWTVIGPKDIVAEFASGNATYFDLEQYMDQTPVSSFLGRKGIVKVIANLKEGQDSVRCVLKPFYKKSLDRSLARNNFEFVGLNISSENSVIVADIDFYAKALERLPQPKPREDAAAAVAYIDSTIVLDKGPFELVDFVKGGKCYLEQAPNLKLRLLDGKRKGVWTIPFDTPICGSVVQVDFFKNNKLQMLFASQNKLYLVDRVGRMVRGFPKTLPDKVVYGPEVFDLMGDKNYSFMVLNEDNSVAIYQLTKDKVDKGVKIKAPEFVKELPEIVAINGKNYLFLKTVSYLRVYDMKGSEIIIKDKKRMIAPDSEIIEVGGDDIKVKGVDGKDFILNLSTGKTKKV